MDGPALDTTTDTLGTGALGTGALGGDGRTPALDVAGLSYSFGARRVLDGVGFQVRPGGFTVLLGPNGAGKTTLFALITRLYHARTGRIAVFGHDMRADAPAALARIRGELDRRGDRGGEHDAEPQPEPAHLADQRVVQRLEPAAQVAAEGRGRPEQAVLLELLEVVVELVDGELVVVELVVEEVEVVLVLDRHWPRASTLTVLAACWRLSVSRAFTPPRLPTVLESPSAALEAALDATRSAPPATSGNNRPISPAATAARHDGTRATTARSSRPKAA